MNLINTNLGKKLYFPIVNIKIEYANHLKCNNLEFHIEKQPKTYRNQYSPI